MTLLTKPMGHQIRAVEKMEEFNGRMLLADDPGLGKSLSSLMYVDRHPDLRPVVVVCPASLKWNWQNEITTHLGVRSTVLEGTRPRGRPIAGCPIWVINYDILHAWLPWLQDLKPKVVIADEVHYARSSRARRTKMLRKLVRGVKHFLALSGTPICSRPAELFSVLNMLRPDLYPSFHVYAQDFCNLKRRPWGWDYSGAKALPRLHRELTASLMLRRRKEDVLKDLPDRTLETVTLPLDDPSDYRKAELDFARWIREKNPTRANAAMRMEMAVRQGYLLRLAARRKIPAVYEWLDNFLEETDEKLLVFGVHKNILRAVHESYPGQSVLVTGEVTGRDRQLCFDQFNRDKKTRLFVGNVQAAGVGWSCRSASSVAFVELPWLPAEVTQAIDRVRGIGRGVDGVPASVFFLLAHGTVEEDLCRTLQGKQDTVGRVLDGRGGGKDLDIHDLVKEAVLRRAGG